MMLGTILLFMATQAAPAPSTDRSDAVDLRGKEAELATCMWDKSPKQAKIAMKSTDQMKFFMALVKGGQACDFTSATVEIETMREALRATDPAKSKD